MGSGTKGMKRFIIIFLSLVFFITSVQIAKAEQPESVMGNLQIREEQYPGGPVHLKWSYTPINMNALMGYWLLVYEGKQYCFHYKTSPCRIITGAGPGNDVTSWTFSNGLFESGHNYVATIEASVMPGYLETGAETSFVAQ